jgi:hypothetical protein
VSDLLHDDKYWCIDNAWKPGLLVSVKHPNLKVEIGSLVIRMGAVQIWTETVEVRVNTGLLTKDGRLTSRNKACHSLQAQLLVRSPSPKSF